MIATAIAAMHSGDNIHGDLTTSNMMLKPNKLVDLPTTSQQLVDMKDLGILYMIDFGLSMVSSKIEDKAVDIYVLKRAFISTHPGSEKLFERILEQYKAKIQKGLQIIQKFREVEMRGRKRECFG